MKNTITLIVTVIGLIVIIPIAINAILNTTNPFENYQYLKLAQDNQWLGFWGNLIGSALGVSVSLYILNKTYKQNEKNHKQLMEYQILTAQYMQESENYKTLQTELNEFVLFAKNVSTDLFNDNISTIKDREQAEINKFDLVFGMYDFTPEATPFYEAFVRFKISASKLNAYLFCFSNVLIKGSDLSIEIMRITSDCLLEKQEIEEINNAVNIEDIKSAIARIHLKRIKDQILIKKEVDDVATTAKALLTERSNKLRKLRKKIFEQNSI